MKKYIFILVLTLAMLFTACEPVAHEAPEMLDASGATPIEEAEAPEIEVLPAEETPNDDDSSQATATAYEILEVYEAEVYEIEISDEEMPNDDVGAFENIFSLPNFSHGMIFVNGVALSGRLFTAEGEAYPTHIPFLWDIIDILEWQVMGAGGQTAIFRYGEIPVYSESLAEFIWAVGYLEEFDANAIGADDPFPIFDMPGGAFIESYLPISLFRYMGYEAYFADGNVYINDEH